MFAIVSARPMFFRNAMHFAAAFALWVTFSGQSLAAALADAAESGDWAAAQSLLGTDVAVDEAQADGTTALLWAAYHRNAALASELLERGADANAVNRNGMSAILLAATVGDAETIGVLLEHGADANTAAAEGDTALMLAARSGNIEAVRSLLDAGAEVDPRESWHGETALIWAAGENHADIVALLIEHGAEIGVVTTEFTWDLTQAGVASQLPRGGITALTVAARENALEAARVLLDAGADVNALDPDGISVLRVAIANDNRDMAMLLLEAGADPHDGAFADAVKFRSFPVVRAEKHRTDETSSLELVEALLAAGADVNAVPEKPMTRQLWAEGMAHPNEPPLWLAAQGSDLEMMRLLAEHGADAATTLSSRGESVLMAAMGLTPHSMGGGGTKPPLATNVALELGVLALELGSPIDAVDNDGETALHLAAEIGHDELIPFLLEQGAALDAIDNNNRMPIDAAAGAPGIPRIVSMPTPNPPDPASVALLREAMAAAGIAEVPWVAAPPKEEEDSSEEAAE